MGSNADKDRFGMIDGSFRTLARIWRVLTFCLEILFRRIQFPFPLEDLGGANERGEIL